VGIPAAKKGVPKIDVIFDIDANGIIKVSAKDQATGKEQAIRITPDSGLSKGEVDRMTSDIGQEFANKINRGDKPAENQEYRQAAPSAGGDEGLPGAAADTDSKKKKSIFDIFKKKEG
jgi:molecular chaperone DnaK (HSP70)